MPRIRIKNIPNGFELKKKAQGGSTGDQTNYQLVTSPVKLQGDQVNRDRDVSTRKSLKSVPRDQANIEAEGGETVLSDLNNDGMFGLYNITGPSHDDGGVPMNLPDQSFVFSRDPSLFLSDEELAQFDMTNSKAGKSPAQVSRKFDLNKYYGLIKDSYADEIQVNTAEMMMDKNMRELSKLAFVQEAKKDFEDGVPLSSFVYLQEQGVDPMQFKQQIEGITEQAAKADMLRSLPPEQQQGIINQAMFMQQMQQAEATRQAEQNMQQNIQMQDAYQQSVGTGLPVARYGGGTSDDPQLVFNEEPSYFENTMANFMSRVDPNYIPPVAQMPMPMANRGGMYRQRPMPVVRYGSELTKAQKGTETNQDKTALYKISYEGMPNVQAGIQYTKEQLESVLANQQISDNVIVTKIGSDEGYALASHPDFQDLSTETTTETTAEAVDPMSDYNQLKELFKSDNEEWQNTIGGAYTAFKSLMQKQGYSEDQIPSMEDMVDNILMDYQFAVHSAKAKIPDQERLNPVLDSRGNMQNQLAQDLFNKYEIDYQIDADKTAFNQAFMQALKYMDMQNPVPFLTVTGEGPEQSTNVDFAPNFSKVDKVFGNNTIAEILTVNNMPEPEPDPEPDPDPEPVPELKQDFRRPPSAYYKQDLENMKTQAAIMARRRLGLPADPNLIDAEMQYALLDPSAFTSAANAEANAIRRGFASTASAGSYLAGASAISKQVTPKIQEGIMNVQGKVNIPTINTFGKINFEGDIRKGVFNEKNRQGYIDKTEAALEAQNIEQLSDLKTMNDLYVNAITNKAKTDVINTLQDYYYIDPRTGGTIDMYRTKPGMEGTIPSSEDRLDNMLDVAERLETMGVDVTLDQLMKYEGLTSQDQEPLTEKDITRQAFANMPAPYTGQQFGLGGMVGLQVGAEDNSTFRVLPFSVGLTGV